MSIIDGEKVPSIHGAGAEGDFLGTDDFGSHLLARQSYSTPAVGAELAGARSSVYFVHLDSPIPFTHSLRATEGPWATGH